MSSKNFQDSIAALERAVLDDTGERLSGETFAAETLEDFERMAKAVAMSVAHLRSKGHRVGHGGAYRTAKKSTWITCPVGHIRVSYTPPIKKTAMAATSLAAYRTTNFSTQEGKIAHHVLLVSMSGKDTTRAEIAHALVIQEGRVSGRVNAMLKPRAEGGYRDGGLFFAEQEYRITLTAPRLSRFVGASDKINEAFKFVPCVDLPQQGAQTYLFQ